MFAKLAMGFLVFTALTTAYAVQDGFVDVAVDEYREGGTHLHIIAPASLGMVAAHFVPRRELSRIDEEIQRLLPTLKLAATELVKLPDFVLVEVRSDREHILVTKVGSGLEIEEDSPREHVKVWVPLRAVYDTAEVLTQRFSGN
jgi:hypothetical protein